jgi:hypothetical protein
MSGEPITLDAAWQTLRDALVNANAESGWLSGVAQREVEIFAKEMDHAEREGDDMAKVRAADRYRRFLLLQSLAHTVVAEVKHFQHWTLSVQIDAYLAAVKEVVRLWPRFTSERDAWERDFGKMGVRAGEALEDEEAL